MECRRSRKKSAQRSSRGLFCLDPQWLFLLESNPDSSSWIQSSSSAASSQLPNQKHASPFIDALSADDADAFWAREWNTSTFVVPVQQHPFCRTRRSIQVLWKLPGWVQSASRQLARQCTHARELSRDCRCSCQLRHYSFISATPHSREAEHPSSTRKRWF